MPCSKEDIMKNYENSGHVCRWQSYQQLLLKFKEASLKGDIERMANLKIELHDLCQLCGAFPIPEIMRILEDVELPENEASYLRNSFNLIERCADQLDFKTIHTLVTDINRITGCNCQKCKHKEFEPTMQGMGFGNMFMASRRGSNAPTPESHAIERTIQNNHDIIPRNGIMTQFERACINRTSEEPQIHSTYGHPPIETRDLSTGRIPYGFGEMIESIFPHNENSTTPRNKPHVVRRGMGFLNMLEASGKGTFNDQDDKPRARRGMGFANMLRDAARGTE